jgi:succinate dehydrogenase/fumarate reductase flavoprotein subunit
MATTGREGTTVIGTRMLDGRTGPGEVARTGLRGGNPLASTSLLEGLVFGSSVGEVVAAGARNGPTLLVADRARRAIECRLATMIPATAGPLSLLSLSTLVPSLSPLSSSSSLLCGNSTIAAEAITILVQLRLVMWVDVRVIRSCMGLKQAVSELSAMLDKAGRFWEEVACGSGSGGHSGRGGGRQQRCATRRALAWPWQIVIGLQMGAACKRALGQMANLK